MQNGEVVISMFMSNGRIKKKTMKAVSEFPGVTKIDVTESGKIKVTGEFDSHALTRKLRKIYKHARILEVRPADGEHVQNLVQLAGQVGNLFLGYQAQGRTRQPDGCACTIM